MTTRPAAIFRNPLLLVLLSVLLFGTACNQTASVTDVPTVQEAPMVSEIKTVEDSRIKQTSRKVRDTLGSVRESIAEIWEKTDADTTLLHLKENTVVVQAVAFGETQRQEAEEKSPFGPHVTALSTGFIGTVVSERPDEFKNLSGELRRKFVNAGLGGERGQRTVYEARQLYRQSVPRLIRDMGEDPVWTFLHCQGDGRMSCKINGKDWSHKCSYTNCPDKVKDPKNGAWEDKSKNRSRGAENMNPKESFQAKWSNHKDIFRSIQKRPLSVPWLKYAKWGGGLGMIAEMPVAGFENLYSWKHGQKSAKQAFRDTGISTAIGAGTGVVAHVGFIIISSSSAIAPVMVPLAIVGGVVYIGTTIYRIIQAANPDLNWGTSLNELYNTALQQGGLWGKKIGEMEWLPIFSRDDL